MNESDANSEAAGNRDTGNNSLRSRVPLACRNFLRAALAKGGLPADDAHGRECASCADLVSVHRRLASWLKTRPTPPAALTAPNLLSAIHERVIDAAEASALGELVGQLASKGMATPAAGGSWAEDLLDSPLARAAVSPPAPQSAVVWARVGRTILAEVRATPVRRWRRRLWFGVTGVAAALIVSVLLFHEGPPTPTTIVFTDLETPPNVDLAVLRYGALR